MVFLPGWRMVKTETTLEFSMLAWSTDFETGSPLVDTQHQMLIEKINALEQLLAGPPPSKTDVDQLLEFLDSYVKFHFTFEERCMDHHRCPAREQNKKAHGEFLAFFRDFSERYRAEGPKRELLYGLQARASDWIRDHILTVDTQLNACVRS